MCHSELHWLVVWLTPVWISRFGYQKCIYPQRLSSRLHKAQHPSLFSGSTAPLVPSFTPTFSVPSSQEVPSLHCLLCVFFFLIPSFGLVFSHPKPFHLYHIFLPPLWGEEGYVTSSSRSDFSKFILHLYFLPVFILKLIAFWFLP